MKNRFILKNSVKKYDFVIVIPTIFKEENNKRVEKIIELINKYPPPKNFTWNIYLAYEGNDWNEAINISFERLKSKVNKGFLLMDDDAFPTLKWMNNFEDYIKKYKNSILQFALIDKMGIIRWETKIYKLSRLSMAFLAFYFFPFFLKKYVSHSTKYLYNHLPILPIKIHAACFSTVFIPKKILLSIGKVIQNKKVMYGEDWDFCYRALMKGFTIYKIPREVFHNLATTKSGKKMGKINKIYYSDIFLYNKWFTNKEFIKKLREENLIEEDFIFLKILKNELKHIFLKIKPMLNKSKKLPLFR